MIDLDALPSFINEQGVKWWIEKPLTDYARRQGFKKAIGYLVEDPDGYKTYAI